MKTAEILSLISIISFVIAGITLVLAVFFWFRFKIPTVIGDLSGRTARKSIAKMRESNERSGSKTYRPSAVNASRGKITANMTAQPAPRQVAPPAPVQPKGRPAARPAPAKAPQQTGRPETGLLAENKAQTYETAQTEILGGAEVAPFLEDANETMPLVDPTERVVKRTGGKKLEMLDEVMLIHTDEVI